jgi:hypothetical protein
MPTYPRNFLTSVLCRVDYPTILGFGVMAV